MALCDQCRKDKAIDTPLDTLRNWLFRRLFPKEYTDLAEEKYTRGFGEGYAKGLQSAASHKEDLARVQAEYFKENNEILTKPVPKKVVSHVASAKRRGTNKQKR